MPMQEKPRCVLRVNLLNGESPAWDESRRRLFWVDIRAPALHASDPATGLDEKWDMPAWIGCIGLGEPEIAVALRTGLHAFDINTGALRALAGAPFDARRFIFNDGGCDPIGRFIAGPMYIPLPPETKGAKRSPFWRHDVGDYWTAVTQPVSTANGLAWSPDGRTMYHSDTEQHTIWAHDYDPTTGAVARTRVFATLDVKDGGPDGASVDRDGFYWCAVFANGCLMQFDPDGKLERRVELPIRYPTMPTIRRRQSGHDFHNVGGLAGATRATRRCAGGRVVRAAGAGAWIRRPPLARCGPWLR